ncbi:DinB family protein [Pseudobacillus badius]|uniref:DinB family protein n=1 Tax=Bacillus badius TaxID=1455 RepID=UPI0007B085DB|nr:DinB family protein [Bacillus badius]KZN99716.1 hypothetical protein A4244_17110 [Bacillus badius]OCS85820.1 hypothetical protein A6M11_17125 [Bacillus badius]OVE51822.1 hypothetical protein B1A98_09705 [Bacillus badius]TDW03248.1 DinB family protein [Bacillus badius]
MNKWKQEILQHQLDSIAFVQSLHSLSEKDWRAPINEGKWTAAEIIGHFTPWDEFVLQKRLPYLSSECKFPESLDVQAINAQAASMSRQQQQQETISRFVSVRKALYQAIDELPDDRWEVNYTIGTASLSLYEYFKGLAEHDLHHFEQIKQALSLVK